MTLRKGGLFNMRTKIVRDYVWQEWVVKVWDDNDVRQEEMDYHTDDRQDAIDTEKAMHKGKS